MSLDLFIVQHAEKESTPGDPGLTGTGCEQARACGVALARLGPFDELWSSPFRRAVETATHVAGTLGIAPATIRQDDRIRERMNWPGEPRQTSADFAREWARTTVDREFRPEFGDSSRAAGDRLAAFMTELHARLPEGRALVVAHGGVTVDLARTWFGDDCVNDLAPGVIDHGIPACGITAITLSANERTLRTVGADATAMVPGS